VTLNGRSIANLAGVHPDLVRVVLRAAADGASFIVTEGVRSSDRQAMLVSAGKSRTLRSRHLATGDPPLGHAVDLAVVTIDGEVSWRREDYHRLHVSMEAAARELGIPIRWGGNFGGGFFDGPHWELPRAFYPDPPLDFSSKGQVTQT
jgi:peptidoglycan L-alanyl-D-glutamate endopeptidase CwlK